MANAVSALSATKEEIPIVLALHCSGSTGGQWQPLGDALGARCIMTVPDLIGASASRLWRDDHPFLLDRLSQVN
jgi:hypothetical protein